MLAKRRSSSLLMESGAPVAPLPERLRLLSFNIQVGIHTARYREYLTRGWRQFVHDAGRPANLDRIGTMLADFDLVALQEVDAGSLRTGFANQVAWLAARAQLPFWYAQRNRRFGRFAQHGNGLLAKVEPLQLDDHPLPSTLPGRGAILARFACPDGTPLLAISAHLSLGSVARARQLAWIAERVQGEKRVILMGDLNSSVRQLLDHSALRRTALVPAPRHGMATYPSWQPRLDLDHVLLSPDLVVEEARVLRCHFSDHLPLAVVLRLPPATS
ncbi:MAG TPA: endonuclease/exonuclease/phosphatase family protein [Pseudomonadales bacterium]|nr:endonuclease/exonuclease/phosphatase family protein [Pseudomonadales bacterium]